MHACLMASENSHVGGVEGIHPAKSEVYLLREHKKLGLGERAAGKLTGFCGSWTFIFLVFVYVSIWVSLNTYAIMMRWDPYPFILLNMTLSCLAAIQAPIILMGQNLGARRDRRRAEYDYAVNRKAEREIAEIKQELSRIRREISLHEEKSMRRAKK